MRTLLFLALALSGCQASVWTGTWTGSATLNDGRMPTTASGTLTISPGAGTPAALMFGFKGKLAGGTKEFSCLPVLSSANSTATTATMATGTTCKMTAAPDDGCTYDVVINSGEFALAGNMLSGSGNGRLTSACPGQGSATSDFGFTVTAQAEK
jgi:hypothetical protein